MRKQRFIMIMLMVGSLWASSLACGTTDDSDQLVRTLAEEQDDNGDTEDNSAESVVEPTTPPPTDIPEIEGLIKEGTHLVGTDIEPGIYVGLSGEGLLDSCYWERLSGLSGEFGDLLANGNSEGLYYLEILGTDTALTTACELLPIDVVPPPETYLTELASGMYIVGRDIEPGIYRGEAGTDALDSCYWERLSCVYGEFDCIIANDNSNGQYFVEVSPTDFALQTGCTIVKAE